MRRINAGNANVRNGSIAAGLGGKPTLLCGLVGAIVQGVKKRVSLGVLLGGSALLASCVRFGNAEPPFVVNVRGEGAGCHVTVDGERVTSGQLLEVAKRAANRRAIVVYAKLTPYRCIGGSIFTIQRAGIASVDAAMWDGS